MEFNPKLFLTPYFALREVEDEPSRSAFRDAFLKLSTEERDPIVAVESADIIQDIADRSGVSEFAEALSFCARQILCGLTTATELAPWFSEQTKLQLEKSIALLQQLVATLKSTQFNTGEEGRVSSPPPVIPGQQVNPNNIIDLRQQNK
ncbi:MAG: hypothetical protein AAB667_00155 [Patescibacteria group bacterium]